MEICYSAYKLQLLSDNQFNFCQRLGVTDYGADVGNLMAENSLLTVRRREEIHATSKIKVVVFFASSAWNLRGHAKACAGAWAGCANLRITRSPFQVLARHALRLHIPLQSTFRASFPCQPAGGDSCELRYRPGISAH